MVLRHELKREINYEAYLLLTKRLKDMSRKDDDRSHDDVSDNDDDNEDSDYND